MYIAQHLVAGEEGGFCRDSHENVNASVVFPGEDHAGADAFAALPTDETKLPWQVHHAQHRASNARGLPNRARDLLAELARTVDHRRPLSAIFAKRRRIAERAQLTSRTLCRALADLEEAGFITRKAQLRLDDGPMKGTFDGVHLHLTEKAAVLLGLINPEVAHGSTPAHKASDGSEDSRTAQGLNGFEQADDDAGNGFAEPHAKVAHGAYIRDLSPVAFQKRQPGQVPADLERLRSLGFSKFLIFGLMRDAREQGKRLSDVVQATWHGLKRSDKPICYLRSLLKRDVDFGAVARAREAAHAAERNAVAERDAADALVRSVGAQTFVDESGEQLARVDPDGVSMFVSRVDESGERVAAGPWQIGFAAAVRTGRIRVATEADLKAFAQARRRHTVPVLRPDSVPRVLTDSVRTGLAGVRAALHGPMARLR
ncbi:hypothetical protein [Paraburkholderia humisilvae]|uniref:Uncharacterized protein n=1 Tax=Paraburkholderia humisilvae TaxID=627669 RepID=A0A6J5EX67_9BURK|nr:hypothetical protein [Paraburkholderia humisilvae]CAB3770773.1 hypothetical protein LMG29542_06438 [Paraburkholderia humisilvae]